MVSMRFYEPTVLRPHVVYKVALAVFWSRSDLKPVSATFHLNILCFRFMAVLLPVYAQLLLRCRFYNLHPFLLISGQHEQNGHISISIKR